MKLIVTIPAYNEEDTIASVIREIPRQIEGIDAVEVLVVDDGSHDGTVAAAQGAGADYVISNPLNRGLAATFKRALQEAVARGADVIVNTDADNHYDQGRIPDLVAPLLARRADITIGSRLIDKLPMRAANKYGNKVANFIMQRLLRIPKVDVSTGFRGYTREASLKLNVLSDHTYTHETLINALDQRLRIVNVPLAARHVERPSRLIKGIASHIVRAGGVIVRSFLLYRPMQVYGMCGTLFFVVGSLLFARYGYYFVQGQGGGHVQSLIFASALWFVGGQMIITGLLAMAIGWNRRMLEEVLFRMKIQQGGAARGESRTRLRSVASGMEDADAPSISERMRDAA